MIEMWKFLADEGCQFAVDPRPLLKNQVCIKYHWLYIHVSALCFRNEKYMREFWEKMKPFYDALIEKYKYDSSPA